MNDYKNRIADYLLEEQLEATGAVLIQGPKWCGKTTTAAQCANSAVYMDDPARKDIYLKMAETAPLILFEGAKPRLIDEWQLAPQLWDAARFDISQKGENGLYIFTGSSVPADESKITHSGAGRFGKITMRPMSLWESGESNGSVSLTSMFDGEMKAAAANAMTIDELSFLICRGGWPGTLTLKPKAALLQARNYVDLVVDSDISRVDGVKRNSQFARRLLKSYARNQGAQVSVSTIYDDLKAHNDEPTLSQDTIVSYINALRKMFVIEDSEAWNPNLRSKTAIRTSDTRYFVDPSIAAAAMGVGPKDLIADLNTMGLLFETLCIRDLRVYAEALDGKVYHYRDRSELECDAVIHLRNGSYGLVEIKLGGETLVENGATSLLKLASKIDTDKMKAPSFMMVITGIGEYAYRRDDGIYVVPISALKQ
ncbi:MAG: DUF4143 domain-containing protein [Paludibacteraceae bacterium]|nr:DUF4143 domain-containing protein [Paludibacteraceae bacterium]